MSRTFAIWGAALAFVAVGLGAFGAHALREQITPESLAIYQTGVQYQMIHALALLIFSGMTDRIKRPAIVGWLFVYGVLIFSGSLYLLAITGHRWLGAITPFGGLCFLTAWAMLAIGLATAKQSL